MLKRELVNERLACKNVSVVGLGCSSFSGFFGSAQLTVDTVRKEDPLVQGWIQSIRYAVEEAGINVLDTAPWYGHGVSEAVVGWGLEEVLKRVKRKDLIVNTKIGRYEADPKLQFDFSRKKTLLSVQTSLQRLQIEYIDVLQLHDPEFCLDLRELLDITIPAMLECRELGYCKSLGITGYPLEVQHKILQESFKKFGTNVFDQSLTYGHYNLFTQRLTDGSLNGRRTSFFEEYTSKQALDVLAAAPLAMGLLTPQGPPDWHPASEALKDACKQLVHFAQAEGADIVELALLFALSNPSIPCTLLGMCNIQQIKQAQSVCSRLQESTDLSKVLTESEAKVLQNIQANDGVCREVKASNLDQWDGIHEVRTFWKQAGVDFEAWHD